MARLNSLGRSHRKHYTGLAKLGQRMPEPTRRPPHDRMGRVSHPGDHSNSIETSTGMKVSPVYPTVTVAPGLLRRIDLCFGESLDRFLGGRREEKAGFPSLSFRASAPRRPSEW
jgi:hypothetical protein